MQRSRLGCRNECPPHCECVSFSVGKRLPIYSAAVFFIPRNEAGGSLAAFSYAVRTVNVGGCSKTVHMLKW